ncbi:MAG: amino acid permease [Candidatus Caldarchaeum sp.]|nr:amino acid permease [Candidatus Caldarchaeum sp.]
MPDKVFVRDATGLVREIGFLDHLVTNMNGVVPLAAIVLTPWWVFFAVKGGDLLLAIVGGYLFTMLGSLISYSMISATFSRSAAPYIANSRVIHPAIGWPTEVLMWLGWVMALALYPGFIITWGLVPGLYTIGVSSGNRAFIDAAYALNDPLWSVLVGFLIIVPTSLIAILGTRKLVRTFQLPITIIMFIAIVVLIGVWASASKPALDAALLKYLNRGYNDILSFANSSYPDYMIPPIYGFVPIMAAIAFTAGSFNTYWNSWAVGEVRRASDLKMQLISMMVPSTFIAVVVGVIAGLGQLIFGRDFLLSMTLILSYNPDFFEGVPGMAGFSTMTLIPMMIVDNPVLQFIIMLGSICAGLAYIPANWLILSRQWFAWSFDRLIPSKFSEVSEKFHTPVWSIMVNMAVALVFMVLFIYYIEFLGFFTTAAWDTTLVAITMLCVSAALLPARKELWKMSPANRYRIAGIPVIVIGGILGTIYNGAAVLFYTITPELGFGLPSTLLLVTVFLIPFILYWVVRSLRRRQGIDIDLIFKSLPPE